MAERKNGSTVDRRTVLAGTGVALAATLAGCLDGAVGDGDGARETHTEQFDAASLDVLSVETPHGSVHVEGVDRETIDLTAEKRADSRAALDTATLSVDRADGRLAVSVDVERSVDRDGSAPRVDLELQVPADLRLARAEAVTGAVDVSSVAGDLVATSTNGAVTVADVDGGVEAESTNGRVDVEDVDGDVEAATTTGRVEVEDVHGDVTAETTNGDVAIRAVAGDASVDTVTGSVTTEDVEGEVRY